MRESWLRFATSDERGRQVFLGEGNGRLRMPSGAETAWSEDPARRAGRTRLSVRAVRSCCAHLRDNDGERFPVLRARTRQGVTRHDRHGQRPDE
jgi:hypothetical protein